MRPVLQVDERRMRAARTRCCSPAAASLLPLAADGPEPAQRGRRPGARRRRRTRPEHAIEAINLESGSAAGPDGPYTLDGEFAIAAQPFEVTARLGQIAPDSLEHAASWW